METIAQLNEMINAYKVYLQHLKKARVYLRHLPDRECKHGVSGTNWSELSKEIMKTEPTKRTLDAFYESYGDMAAEVVMDEWCSIQDKINALRLKKAKLAIIERRKFDKLKLTRVK